MQCDPETGLIDSARWIPSPNFDQRIHPACISTLVIHAISLPPGKFGGQFVEQLFCNRLDSTQHPYFTTIAALKVSAHFYIKRSGELLQFVSTRERAWHAGISTFMGLDRVNDFSLGIELEGCDDQPYEEAQYQTLAPLSRCLMQAYPAITRQRITAHSDIAPGRKTDPGPYFDWVRYRGELHDSTVEGQI